MNKLFLSGKKKFLFLFILPFLFSLVIALDVSDDFDFNAVGVQVFTPQEVITFKNDTGFTNSSQFANIWVTAEGLKDDVSDIDLNELGDTNVPAPTTNSILNWGGASWISTLLTSISRFLIINNGFELDFNQTELNTTVAQIVSAESATFPPFSIITQVGNLDSGDIDSIINVSDGNSYNVSEVGGTPGFTIEINFTNVTSFTNIQTHDWYIGSVAHIVDIKLFNRLTGIYDDFGDLPNSDGFMIHNFPVANSLNYVNGTNVSIQINHASAGNPNHDLFLDFIELQKTASITQDHSELSGLADDDHTQYLLTNGVRNMTGNITFSGNESVCWNSCNEYIGHNGSNLILQG